MIMQSDLAVHISLCEVFFFLDVKKKNHKEYCKKI